MTTNYAPSRIADFSSNNLNVRCKGIRFTATAGVETSFDFQFPEDRMLTEGFLILKGHAFGDSIKLQIVDVDGLLAPAGTVLNQFYDSWFVADDTQVQRGGTASYPAKVYQGLYLRVIYNSTGGSDVGVCINLTTHKILS